jgi:hypothetical protein
LNDLLKFKPSPKSLKTHLPILVDKIEVWSIYIYMYINFFRAQTSFASFHAKCETWSIQNHIGLKALQVENICKVMQIVLCPNIVSRSMMSFANRLMSKILFRRMSTIPSISNQPFLSSSLPTFPLHCH